MKLLSIKIILYKQKDMYKKKGIKRTVSKTSTKETYKKKHIEITV